MALLKCPDCGHNVSDQAEMCPGCGYPVNKIKAAISNKKTEDLPQRVCPECDMPLKHYESHCMNCGRSISDRELRQQDAAEAKKHSSAGSQVAVIIFVLFIAIIVLHLLGIFDTPWAKTVSASPQSVNPFCHNHEFCIFIITQFPTPSGENKRTNMVICPFRCFFTVSNFTDLAFLH